MLILSKEIQISGEMAFRRKVPIDIYDNGIEYKNYYSKSSSSQFILHMEEILL